jgi:hypothetical protein
MWAATTEVRQSETAYVEQWKSESHARQLHELAIFEVGASDMWAGIAKDIDNMDSLEDDWDGDGAIRPSKDLIEAAAALVQRWSRDPGASVPNRVTAMPSGTISIEWESCDGRTEVEIESPEEATISFIAPGAVEADVTFVTLDALDDLPLASGTT